MYSFFSGCIKRAALVFGERNKESHVGNYTVTLDTRESIQRGIYLGMFESEETAWFNNLIKPGMIVIDVGANIGYYSLIASALVGEIGNVYSFEPSDYAYQQLRSTIRKNKITNIRVYNNGLSDHSETRELRVRDTSLHSPSFCYDGEYTTTSVGTCSLITLDLFAEEANLDHIDLIKIDVEGMEMNVLKGMARLLQENRVHRIMVEFNGYWLKLTNSSPDELDAFLKANGFVVEFSKEYSCQKEEISIANYMYVNQRYQC